MNFLSFFISSYLIALSQAQWEATRFGSLPEGDPPGVSFDYNQRIITIDENLLKDEGENERANFIVLLNYNGGEPPSVIPQGNDKRFLSAVKSDDGNFYLKLTNNLDFEEKDSFFISFLPEFGGEDSPFVRIVVKDLNDNPPEFIKFPEQPLSVTEKLEAPGVITTFNATDIDTMDSVLSYSLQDLGTGETPFSINSSTGVLSFVKEIDYLKRTTYRLQISVSDSDNIHTVKAPILTTIDIIDTPDLPPRWLMFSYRLETFENAENTILYTYEAQDQDLGILAPIKYSSENFPQNEEGVPYLSINSSTGALNLDLPIDLEKLNGDFLTFTIDATENDDVGLSTSLDVTLFVKDVNDNSPVFEEDKSNLKEFTIDIFENFQGVFPNLTNLIIVDADKTLEFSNYSASLIEDTWIKEYVEVIPNENSYGKTLFTLSPKTGFVIDFEDEEIDWSNEISFKIDFKENTEPYSFAQAVIKLNVHDLNDNAPEFEIEPGSDGIDIDVYENQSIGSIGFIKAIDKDSSKEFGEESIRYSWYKTTPTYLELDNITGEIRLTRENGFNYENQQDVSYVVEAVDCQGIGSPLRGTALLLIHVKDVNDEAPRISLNSRTVDLVENEVKGHFVMENIEISDVDTEPSLDISYEVTSRSSVDVSSWFSFELESPSVNLNYLTIKVNETPDYETTDQVEITITVVDLNTIEGKPNSTSASFSIRILNLNDESPEIEKPKSISVRETEDGEEDDADSRVIYTFRASDKDSSVLSFSLDTSLELKPLLGLVDLEESTGVLRRKEGVKIDREDENLIEGNSTIEALFFTLTVTDNGDEDGNNRLSSSIDIEIQVIDINDNAPKFLEGERKFNVIENANLSDVIGKVEATDKDSGNFGKISYFIDKDYNNGIGTDKFKIEQNSGIISVNGGLDRETVPDYKIKILAIDNYRTGSESNSIKTSLDITIYIDDFNDNAPYFYDDNFLSKDEDKIFIGSEIGSVRVNDDDSEGVNSELQVNLKNVTWNCQNCDKDNLVWTDLFDSEFNETEGLFYITSKIEFASYYGDYNLTIYAVDNGVPPLSNEVEIPFKVVDINDNAPKITYPQNGSAFYVNETLRPGENLIEYNGKAVGSLEAFDEDDPQGPNGKVDFMIDPASNPQDSFFDIVRDVQSQKFYIQVKKELQKGNFNISILAKDNGSPSKNDSITFIINVIQKDNAPPEFSDTEFELEIIENQIPSEELAFTKAIDSDTIIGEDGFEMNIHNETICYFLTDGDTTNSFAIKDVHTNNISLIKSLDREEVEAYDITIIAINCRENEEITPPSVPPSDKSVLKVKINVIDVKDTPPAWTTKNELFSGGVKTDSLLGSSTSIILSATDQDLNEELVYQMSENVYKSNTALDSISPPIFRLDNNNEILINFQPNAGLKGYFEFKVNVTDTVGMFAEKLCKVFIITQNNVVEFRFNNFEKDFTNKTEQVADILSGIFSYRCTIDKVVATVDENGSPLIGKTTLETHFTNDADNFPVNAIIITEMQYDVPELFGNLTRSLSEIDLNLDLLSYLTDNNNVKESKLLTYILFAGVGVLAIVLVIISVTCYFSNKSLSRRIRALSATAFGSQQSGLNKTGAGGSLDLPNTNQHAIQGSNPIWSTKEPMNEKIDFDAESVGSGGSVLIGVESDEDFKDYKSPTEENGEFVFNRNPYFDNDEPNESRDSISSQNSDQSENENGPPPMSLSNFGSKNGVIKNPLASQFD